MAQRLIGLLALVGALLVFAPWLPKLDPPVLISIDAIPDRPSIEPVPESKPDKGSLPTKAILSALGISDSEDTVVIQSNGEQSSKPANKTVERAKGAEAADDPEGTVRTAKLPVLVRTASKGSAPSSNAYRIRLGIFSNPARAMLRFQSGGYSVVQEKYRESASDTRYALYLSEPMVHDDAIAVSSEINHRYNLKTLIEKYQP
jgi:hypothetical protein